jgi:LytS/YehU family sensor histidine kinase
MDYIAMKDSLVNEKNVEEVTKLALQYEFDKQQLADSLSYMSNIMAAETETELESLRADKNRNMAFSFLFGSFLLFGGVAWYFYLDRRRKQERYEKDVAIMETQALRAQMNPHFIFNVLNSINTFVQQNDQEKASTFLVQFSRLMRRILENSRQATVPLEDDLKALRDYMALERIRMNGKFDFRIDVHPDIDTEEVMVPPLVIQPFIENAIWHGISRKDTRGNIYLHISKRKDQLVMIVEDDGVGRNTWVRNAEPLPVTKKKSLGTAITRSRLELVQKIYGGKAGFRYLDTKVGTQVEVEMPIFLA